MTSKLKTNKSSSKSASAQLDLFAEANLSDIRSHDTDDEFELRAADVEKMLRSFCIRKNADEEVSSDDLLKCQERINTIITYIDRERDGYCKNLEAARNTVWPRISILPVKSPKEHLLRANVLIDGRSKDWEKVNSDLKLAFYKTASDTLQGVFLKSSSRKPRKYAN